jgi:hypothetical protein
LENPLGVAAKFTISVVLVAISSIVLISFYVSEAAIESRIADLGGNTLVLREYYSRFDPEQRGSFISSYFGNAKTIQIHSLIAVPVTARTEFDSVAQVFTSQEGDGSGEIYRNTPTVFSDERLAGISTTVYVMDNQFQAVTQKTPDWLERIVTQDVVVLPYSLCREFAGRNFELVSVLQVQGGPEEAEFVAKAMRSLIEQEDRRNVELLSPDVFSRELRRLRKNRKMWQFAIVFGMGTAMAIILSVISLLEYKQWEFYFALLRSLGMHSFFIYIRYVIDSLIPTLVAAGVTLSSVNALSGIIFPSVGVELFILQRLDLIRFLCEDGVPLLAFLSTGAVFGSLPVAALLYKPIGKIMA